MNRSNTSAIGDGSPARTPSIEVGVINSVDRDEGLCTVITETGREVEAKVSTPMAGIDGTGLRLTPRVESRCLVAILESGGAARPEYSFVIATYDAEVGNTPSWGAPGDFHFRTDSGAEFLVSQGGLIDLKADDWARRSYVPGKKTIKEWVKNKEVLHTPIAHDRTIHDEEAQSGFRELAINSAFMHRDNDQGPDVLQTWGLARGSEKASALHPETGALMYRKAEQRSDRGRAKARYREAVAAARDSIFEQYAEDVQTGASVRRQVGTQDQVIDSYTATQGQAEVREQVGAGVTEAGEAWRQAVEVGEASVVLRRGKFGDMLSEKVFEGSGKLERRVYEDGRMTLSNPTWDIEMQGDGALSVTNGTTTVTIEEDEAVVDNGNTAITLTGSDIYIGSESEPIALGDTLTDFLDAFKKWAKKHTHTHPQGPTGPPMTPFVRPTAPILSKTNYVD